MKAPENGWLEDEFPFLGKPIFRCELLVSGRVSNFEVLLLLPCLGLGVAAGVYLRRRVGATELLSKELGFGDPLGMWAEPRRMMTSWHP